MTRTLKRTGRRLGAVAGVLALGAGALLVGLPGSVSASPRSTTPPLDHFLCYQARFAGPKAPPGVTLLVPQLFTATLKPTFGAANVHCNPANKSVPAALFKQRNPFAHLLCYALTVQTPPEKVLLTNQFGKSLMTTGPTPTKFCLPTWKDRVAPPGLPPTLNQPPGLDHFTCWPLKAIAGSYGFRPPSFVKVLDEFSAPRYVPLKLGTANLVCVPTIKILPTGQSYQTQGPNDFSLVCFPTSPTPIWKQVFDQNQFGSSTVYPNTTAEKFCLPSTLSNQGPAG
jgi:hypothetical protein